MKIDQYCQRQRCKHVEYEQFLACFRVALFVSDSWAFLLPARRFANCESNVSVRPSVTRQYCIMISSASGSPTILVFWCQISSRHSKGFPGAEASNKGGVGKFSHFLALSINISKTVADRPKLPLMTNRKSHTGMSFRLTQRSMTLGDLDLL